MFANWSLRRRLTLSVIVFSAAIIVVIVLLVSNTATAFVATRTESALIAVNQSAARALETELRAVEATTRALGGTLDQREDAILDLWQSASYALRQPDNLIERVGVIQTFGRGYLINVLRRPTSGYIVAPRYENVVRELPPEIAPLISGEAVWFYSAEPSSGSRQPSLVYALRLPGTRGYVWAEIETASFAARLAPLTERTDFPYTVTFADADHFFAAAGTSAAAISAAPAALFRDATEPFTLVETAPYSRAGAVYVITTPLLNDAWRVIGVVSEEAISSESDEESLQIVFVLLVGIFALGWLLDRFADDLITKPLNDLTITAQEIGSGDMRYQIGYQERGDEVGGLARALEDMKLNLAHSYDSLSMWSRTLEKRVAERTQELQIAQAEALNSAAEIRAVYDSSLSVVSEYDLNVILDTLTGRVRDLLRATYCGIWLVTEGRAGIQLVASTSDSADVIGRTIDINEGLAGRVVETGQMLLLADYQHWDGRLGWAAPDMFRALAVPLTHSGESIGAIVAGRPADALDFSADDGRLLTLLANLVSPVVRSAQLYGQLGFAMQKANSANEVKTRFLASVTHELRTPLNLIINNMDFMRIGAFGDINEEQHSRLDQTIRSAEHLLYLINDLLDVSKIEAGEMQLFFQPAEVRPLIEDALDATLAMMTHKPEVALEVDMPEELPEVTMDARRIRQVLLNLLTNGVKFTPAGEVRLKVSAGDDHIAFSVTDTGIGIPENELKQIFEAFERSKRAKEMGIEGTGLGLPISRYLVEAHGGTLTVVTEIGKGSTFTVTLPLTPAPPAAPRRALQLGTPAAD